jgi:hypothetical protein
VETIRSIMLAIASKSSEFSVSAPESIERSGDNKRRRQRVAGLWKREMARTAEGVDEAGASEDWSVLYQLLSLLESLYSHMAATTDHAVTHCEIGSSNNGSKKGSHQQLAVMELVQECVLYPHAWVRAAASRVLQAYLSRRDVVFAATTASKSPAGGAVEVLTAPNALYHLCRRLCVALNQPSMADSLLQALIGCTVFAVRALAHNPHLSTGQVSSMDDDEDEDDDEEDDDEADGVVDEEEQAPAAVDDENEDGEAMNEEEDDGDDDDEKDMDSEIPQVVSTLKSSNRYPGCLWAMQRLKHIGSDARGYRRRNVLMVSITSQHHCCS